MKPNMAKFNKRDRKAIDTVITAINKEYKNATIQCGIDGDIECHPAISSGSLLVDRALGIGGYAIGRIIEIYGLESCGKTTLSLHAIANCQKAGGQAAFIDAEHALDINYAKALGVNINDLILHQPDHAEMALDVVDSLATSGVVDLIVVDSVAALVPKVELEGEMGDQVIGVQARLMSKACRKLAGVCKRNNVTVIFINQIRHKIGVFFGSPECVTPDTTVEIEVIDK